MATYCAATIMSLLFQVRDLDSPHQVLAKGSSEVFGTEVVVIVLQEPLAATLQFWAQLQELSCLIMAMNEQTMTFGSYCTAKILK